MRTHRYCPHCYGQLTRSKLRDLGYVFDCPRCEEDFFRIEVLCTRYVKIVNPKR